MIKIAASRELADRAWTAEQYRAIRRTITDPYRAIGIVQVIAAECLAGLVLNGDGRTPVALAYARRVQIARDAQSRNLSATVRRQARRIDRAV